MSLIAAAPFCTSWAQSSEPHIQWGVSGGVNRYQEKGLMQLQGPEIGVHAKLTQWSALPSVQWEADVLLGKQKYTSEGSGSMTGVTNLETRWRALTPVFSNEPTNQGFLTGLAVHTLWNDLRGTSSTGSGGYERSATQLWLPVRWVSNFWELEAGVLVYGRHTSKLSQANTSPPSADVVNTQKKGAYLQGQLNLQMDARHTLSPYVRYTGLGDSDVVNRTYEPASERWQAGVTWQFTTP